MPCVNHPEVIDGLSPCTKCGKSFCIDCLVGRQAGWFCPACDTEAAVPPPVQVPAAPPPQPEKVFTPKPRPSAGKACANHPEVVDGLNPCTRCDKVFCPDCLVELKGSRFCAGCKLDAVKDIQSGVAASGMQYAGVGARFGALFIDGLVTNAIMIPLFVIMGVIIAAVKPDSNSAFMPVLVVVFYGLFFAAIIGYHGFMLQFKGQTLGKMAMKIKVVTPDGGKITAGQAWIRTFVWMFLAGCLIDYIPVLFNDEKMCVHDMVAKTRVVKIG
jgi:uncharacterized RDD family membrane protein YckC